MTNIECRGNELSLYQCRNEGWMIPHAGITGGGATNATNATEPAGFCGTGRAAAVTCYHNGESGSDHSCVPATQAILIPTVLSDEWGNNSTGNQIHNSLAVLI